MATSSSGELKVEDIKRELAAFVEQGRLDFNVVELLVAGERCAPVECELLDYKGALEDDRFSKARAVLQIVSFFNTYGGYLIYGVTEREAETDFQVTGLRKGSIDVESLKALVREYTGERIGLTLQYFSLPINATTDDECNYLAVVHVPKRTSQEPLAFGKNGPTKEKNLLLFTKDDIYYRRGDECVLAKGKAVLFLAGKRPCPYLDSGESIDRLLPKRNLLEHNLPDREVICPRFIGRRDEIDQLWSWFADEFSHVRVLAGEGGLGKTSIAYQFAEEVCVSPESELERVIWLTAKREQFSGINNQLVPMPETHFAKYADLLNVLCEQLGYLESDIAGVSEMRLKKLIQEGAAITPALIVVDDIDSLEAQEQRKTLEIGFLFGGSKSRLLMTTRINKSYSKDIAIQVSGFEIGDYKKYVETLDERYSFVKLGSDQIEAIYKATSGSPLYTDSLYRLMRWMKPADALREWRGQKGEQARAAALKREVDQLSPEAKRVLLAASMLQECSFSELASVTGYPDSVLGDWVNELQSIYLLSAPQVTAEIRVKVGLNTREYVLLWAKQLATDHAKIGQRVKELRQSARQLHLRRDNPLVGAAINQAIALLKRGNPDEALATVVTAERSAKNHPDLLVMQARCLLKIAPPKADEARRMARRAFDGGARKDVLFEVWYEAEWQADNYTGAAEAAGCAIDNGAKSTHEWLIRRAAATWYIARDQERSRNIDRAITDYWTCASDLKKAEPALGPDTQQEMRQQRFSIHDGIWDLLRKVERGKADVPARAVDEVLRMIRDGDIRIPIFLKLCESLKWFNQLLSQDSVPIEEGLRNLIEQRFRQVREIIEGIARQRHADKRIPYVLEQLREVEQAYGLVSKRRGFASS